MQLIDWVLWALIVMNALVFYDTWVRRKVMIREYRRLGDLIEEMERQLEFLMKRNDARKD